MLRNKCKRVAKKQSIYHQLRNIPLNVDYKIMLALASSQDVTIYTRMAGQFSSVNSPSIHCQQREPLKI